MQINVQHIHRLDLKLFNDTTLLKSYIHENRKMCPEMLLFIKITVSDARKSQQLF